MMRSRFIIVAVCAALAAPAARSQNVAGEGAGDAIRGVISEQIAAFRAGDFSRAFGYASPNIQTMFETPGRFGEMVRQGYSSVLNPTESRFLGLRDEDGREVQRLMVRGADGRVALWDYHMVQVEGIWRIDAVTPVRAEGPGV